ncbi:TRAP transporter small permease subunit [Pseudohalocynthiibacter aestuariivivens]|uniref:TRAP transporter small permease protein n=1 Tax=Roseovarius pelagicus TaxID=2980108 RepID=A0ABY6D8G6_9RHOB|nr:MULTISPECIES: TRAP transporter small permease subunit [Rhodobacterales]QIE45662.1 TRAP transporter small permease subunit [Pseudohalocynthiibacter aestuariivivens]UXX82422.1 TRAP transporter small permease subunit [Roseovarius pelagicus]
MSRLADALDTINRHVGYTVRWLALFMVMAQFGVVLLRYVFGVSWVWANESVLYMHAALFMIAAGYTLLVDEHVRVDIWYAKEGPRGQALTNLLGHLVLLIPSMTVLLLYSWPTVRNSWKIMEGPISVGGIPASFLLKSLIPVFCVLLIIQAVANILRDLARLAGTR